VSQFLSDYLYDLPPHLVASRPATSRELARMLVLHRESGRVEHRNFTDLPEYLAPGICLFLMTVKSFPHGFMTVREKSRFF